MLVTDEKPEVFRTMLSVVDEYNKKGVPLVAHGLTKRLDFRFSFSDEWNLFDNVDAWREATLGTEEERKIKLANPDLRQSMKAEYDRTKQPKALGDIATFICRKVESDEMSKKYRDRMVGDIAREENKHVVDTLLDISAADNWKTEWLTPMRNQNPEYCKTPEPPHGRRFFRWRGAHQVPDPGRVCHRPADLDGAGYRNHHPGAGSPSSELPAGLDRRFQRPGLSAGRHGGRHSGL